MNPGLVRRKNDAFRLYRLATKVSQSGRAECAQHRV